MLKHGYCEVCYPYTDDGCPACRTSDPEPNPEELGWLYVVFPVAFMAIVALGL
jgi:hypothetical protein